VQQQVAITFTDNQNVVAHDRSSEYLLAQHMCWPPLMAIFAPVRKAASSDAR
jgi:hypothetical protein